MTVNNLQELSDLLISEGIDLSAWGTIEGSKHIENLWDEIREGESVIQRSPLRRVVSVVKILIHRGDDILIEVGQELYDGRTRSRHNLPSEKMRAGENYAAAAVRCLEEELGRRRDEIRINESTHQEAVELTESPSYPGLTTQYSLHTVEAEVDGLPSTDFSTGETVKNAKDPIKRHKWAWVPKYGYKLN